MTMPPVCALLIKRIFAVLEALFLRFSQNFPLAPPKDPGTSHSFFKFADRRILPYVWGFVALSLPSHEYWSSLGEVYACSLRVRTYHVPSLHALDVRVYQADKKLRDMRKPFDQLLVHACACWPSKDVGY